MSRRAPLIIAGSGRLGGALARGLLVAGWRVLGWPRTALSAKAWRRLRVPLATPQELARAELLVVATPDEVVATTARALGPSLGPRAALVHCAGGLTLEVLADAAGRRPRGSFHPLCAVSSSADRLAGCGVALSATTRALRIRLDQMAGALDLLPLRVPEAGRTAYHAGAVMAAGGVVSLLAAVQAMWQTAGVRGPDLQAALLALTRTALDGIDRRGFRGGLSGPLARGDAERLRAHLQALPRSLRPLYRELARAGLAIAPTRARRGLAQALDVPSSGPRR